MAIQRGTLKVPTPKGAGAGAAASMDRWHAVSASDVKHRLIMSVQGIEKQGKTHFACTMPGPIGYQGLDIGSEGVVEKFAHKNISKIEYSIDIDDKDADDPRKVAAAADPVWSAFVSDFRDAIRTFRSHIIDTGTEMWELLRMCRFGKLTQVMPHNYGPVNAEFRALIREAYDYDCNIGILHKMKDEWENYTDNKGQEKSRRTGAKKVQQMNDIPFLVQTVVQVWRTAEVPPTFHATITDCRQNGMVMGEDLEGDMCSFPFVAATVFPGTDPVTDWGYEG